MVFPDELLPDPHLPSNTILFLTIITNGASLANGNNMIPAEYSIANPNTNNQVSNWHNTEQDANGGDLLWTVNGKPAWVRARATLERAQLCLSHASMPSRPKAGPALTLRACVRSAVLERQYAPGHGHDRQRVPAELQ